MRLPYHWLTELVKVPADVHEVASALALRGFEVASVDTGSQPVIDFEITANRPDCLSVIGLAREASAAYARPLALPDRTMPPAGPPQALDVTIDEPELCPRYCAQIFELRSSTTTPVWLRDRLEACGVRSISPVVDVTNYVMLEMGQPTHAFDYAKLAGRGLRIRRAKPGERVRTLDGVDRALDPDMLVIADSDRAQAVAGVMGGAESEIGGATRIMVLESAYFKPSSVRRASKKLALKTEASTRFERGADIEAAPAAIARAAALLQQIGAAQPLGQTIDRYPSRRKPLTLTLRAVRIEAVLGMPVKEADVPAILEPLGFGVSEREHRPAVNVTHGSGTYVPPVPRLRSSAVWSVAVPSFRVDVQREIDLVEEIARHDGYVTLPATFPELTAPPPAADARALRDRRLRQLLTSCGLSEAMTFSFIEAAAAEPFATPNPGPRTPNPEPRTTDHGSRATNHGSRTTNAVVVANPLSEKFAVLRPSLLPGLVDAAAHNRRREHRDVRLFETGTRFSPSGETRAVAGVWCGAGVVPHWSGAAHEADFYDVKGVVETICRAFGVDPAFEPAETPYLVRGRSAAVGTLGIVGQIAPAIAEARGFPANEALWGFELDAGALGSAAPGDDLRAESLPRFPSIVRDLSVLVDAALPAASVRGTIRSAAPASLTYVIEFDRYRGKGVPEGRVSLSLRLTFRSTERTLTDAEVDAAMEAVVAALALAHGAVRR